jgi:carboxyl-terminal processing protease
VAFRDRADTRSFGQETGGLSTRNDIFPLSDGAWIFLTVSKFAYRTGEVYGGIITPDEYISDAGSGNDLALEAATSWLLGQPDCTSSKKPDGSILR